MKKRSSSFVSNMFDGFNCLLMAALCIVCLLPVFHVICASFSDPRMLLNSSELLLWPKGFTTVGYSLIFNNSAIVTGYLNTIFYVVTGTALSTVLTIMGGFALSRKNVYWSGAIMFLITFTMFFNGGLIPYYILVSKLGLINSRLSVILPTAINTFNLIIMRTSMKEIPEALEESAVLDGAGALTIMVRIVMPLSGATVAVIVLYYAVAIWNSWFSASMFLRDRKLYPLQLILKEILVSSDTSAVLNTSTDTTGKNMDIYKPLVKYCTITATTLPVLCFYPFVQKYFVKGIMIGSVKE